MSVYLCCMRLWTQSPRQLISTISTTCSVCSARMDRYVGRRYILFIYYTSHMILLLRQIGNKQMNCIRLLWNSQSHELSSIHAAYANKRTLFDASHPMNALQKAHNKLKTTPFSTSINYESVFQQCVENSWERNLALSLSLFLYEWSNLQRAYDK